MELRKIYTCKKASMSLEETMWLAGGLIVTVIIILGISKLPILDSLKNVIPGFGTPETVENNPTPISQVDPCVSDFFWADAAGNKIDGTTVKSGTVYVAMNSPFSGADLAKIDNICKNYALIVNELNHKILNPIISFSRFQDYPTKKLNQKDYFMIPVVVDSRLLETWKYQLEVAELRNPNLITERITKKIGSQIFT